MFRPGSAALVHKTDLNTPGDLTGWRDDDLKILVDEGRRQLDLQTADLERVRNRAQALLAFGLALVGAVGALRQPASEAHCTGLWVLWSATLVVAAWAVLGAAATAAVRADMNLIHAAVLSHYKPPVLKRLADDYAAVVMTGHDQVGTRLTNFRIAVTYLLLATAMALGTWFWAQRAAPEPDEKPPAASQVETACARRSPAVATTRIGPRPSMMAGITLNRSSCRSTLERDAPSLG